MRTCLLTGVLACLAVPLAACSRPVPPPADAPSPTQAPAAAGDDGPTPAAPTTGDSARTANAAEASPPLARFDGYGSARFGSDEKTVQAGWGAPLTADRADEPDGCHYLHAAEGSVALMIEGGRFVRYDALDGSVTAPGGGRVGMTRAEIERLHPQGVASPHKYSEGLYLRVEGPRAAAGAAPALVFETDATGSDAKVLAWHVGLPPQVDYVEGCS